MNRYSTIQEAAAHNVHLHRLLSMRANAEETIVGLVNLIEEQTQRIIDLSAIAPQRIILSDGRSFVKHCPDDHVPVILDLRKGTPT